jgi:hypothetical protein
MGEGRVGGHGGEGRVARASQKNPTLGSNLEKAWDYVKGRCAWMARSLPLIWND